MWHSSVYGLALMLGYLGFDGFTSTFQDKLFKGYQVSEQACMEQHLNMAFQLIQGLPGERVSIPCACHLATCTVWWRSSVAFHDVVFEGCQAI